MRLLSSCLLVATILLTATVSDAAQRLGQGSGGPVVKEEWIALEAEANEAEKAGKWTQAANLYRQAANLARNRSQFQRAIEYGSKSLQSAEKAKAPAQEINANLELALAYRSVAQNSKARDHLVKSVELLKLVPAGNNKINLETRVYGELGGEFVRSKEYEHAIEYIGYSLQRQDAQLTFLERTANRNGQAIKGIKTRMGRTLEMLGDAHNAAGHVEEAAKAYERGLEINKDAGLTSGMVRIQLGLGQLYFRRNDFPRALENFQKALDSAENLGYGQGIQRASSQIGNLLRRTNKSSEAIPYYEKAIARIELTRAGLESEEFRTGFFENTVNTYASMIRAQLQEKNLDDAFNYNERARSRAFLDILGSKVQLGKQAGLIEEEKQLEARIKQLQEQPANSGEDEGDDDDGKVSPPNRELAAAEKAYADFLAKVRKENKEQASLMSVEPLTLKRVQELLDSGVSLLEYFVANDAVVFWVIDKDKINAVAAPLQRKDLQAKVAAIRESISQLEEPAKLNQQAQELYKLLIEPALPHIKGKELLIIPHDVLHYLPFQALLAPDEQYLIEKYPINYLSSASLMQFTQEKRNARGDLRKVLAEGGKVLTFGNPDLGDPKMSLAFAGIEAKEIKSLYPQSTIYLEKEATEEKAKALIGSSDVIHFASHAELNEDDPLASAIRLAKSDKEDGRLEVREIFGMDLKASLVVLSACETGLGKLSSGEELVGLTRAFIYAGTPSVVASLWNVEDSSTAQLMASFYKNLKTMTKVEALRQAQLNLIRGNLNSDLLARRGIGGIGKLGEVPAAKPAADSISNSPLASVSTSHPFFWAPFILVGEAK